jgi:hypothetical protein
MYRFATAIFTALFFISPALSHSQTTPVWFTLNAQEGQTVTAAGSITLRFGQLASTCAYTESTGPCTAGAGAPSPEAWTAPKTFNTTSTVSIVVGAAAFGNVDPLPGVFKTVQVEEQATPQIITVNGQSITVPALPSSSTPPPPTSSTSGWFTLLTPAQQSPTTTVGLPAGTTYRIGDSQNNKWSTPVTTTAAVTIVDYADGQNGHPADPDPGTAKEFDIQEQASPQNVTVNGQSITVPALPSSSTPPPPTSSTPVWFTLLTPAQQSPTTTVGLPVGITYRIGDGQNNKWSTPVTTTAAVTIVDYADGQNGHPADPDPGTAKEFDIEEQATPQNVTINGQSVTVPALPSSYACQLSGTPAAITFQNTTVGYMISSSASITSNCTTSVTIDSVQSPGSPFSTSGFQTPFSLAPGKTQSYTAVFAPTATGTATGSIVFASTVSSVQPLTVALTGTGVASTQGTLSSSPTALSFGNVTVNSTQSQTATITNSGATSVTISGVGVTGTGFSLGSLTTPFTLGVNQSVQLTVGFAPTASGSASGTLTITSNASNSSFGVPLTGTGVTTTHSVSLSWDDTGAQILGYNVYRSTISGGPYSKINGALVVPTNYSDTSVVSGTTYFYVVTAVGTSGMESAFSNQTTAAVP